jgi:hypothetical protein
MAQAPYEMVGIAGLERASGWSPIRQSLGVGAFGINAWTAHATGDVLIPAHDELPSGHEELYLVVSGAASFTVAGDEIQAPAGCIVFVRDPAATRSTSARPCAAVRAWPRRRATTRTFRRCATTRGSPA